MHLFFEHISETVCKCFFSFLSSVPPLGVKPLLGLNVARGCEVIAGGELDLSGQVALLSDRVEVDREALKAGDLLAELNTVGDGGKVGQFHPIAATDARHRGSCPHSYQSEKSLNNFFLLKYFLIPETLSEWTHWVGST